MTLSRLTRDICVLFFLTTPMWAGTVYGGFEDLVGGDYDYNDVVFSISGVTLNQTGGSFYSYSASSLLASNDSGRPFWNNNSYDSDRAHDNIGYCVYGDASDSGACAGHNSGYAPTDQYLATSTGASVTNVTFTPQAGASASVLLTITSDTDTLYWYDVNTPSSLHQITSGTTITTGNNDTDAFGIAANNGSTTFYSQVDVKGNNGGDPSSVSHFAFFENATSTPEPGSMFLLGSALTGMGLFARRKRASL